jgi:two-component system LytT family response regulator
MNDIIRSDSRIKCIIIDDESSSTEILGSLLLSHSRLHVLDKINDPRQALGAILQLKPDLIFLDIQMPGMNGFDLLESLSKTDIKPFVIFVTAYDQFAIQAIRASAFDFILKPIDSLELNLAVERFLAQYNHKQTEVGYSAILEKTSVKKIRFNSTGGFILLNPNDIVYIQADWNYSEIYLSKEKHEVVTMNLGSVEEILPKGNFARISRSVIINLTYLEKVQRGKRLCILKKDGVIYEFKIPILRIRYLEGMV